MAHDLSDAQRVLKLCERVRLLIAIDDDIPAAVKLDTQPSLKMLEAAVDSDERALASQQYTFLYRELSKYPDLEALLSAMRVFLTYL